MVIRKEWIAPEKSRALSISEMENNAYIIGMYFTRHEVGHWTPNAVAGMLGNMQAESTINPARWQGDKEPETEEEITETGYGLVQWTPYTKYADWAGSGWKGNGYKQCERIHYERMNNLQWVASSLYDFSFTEYIMMREAPEYMADAFLKNYERPENPNQPIRGEYAKYWYDYIIKYVMPKIWIWNRKETRKKWYR